MTPANELDNPPFDPTPIAETPMAEFANNLKQYTIVVRGGSLARIQTPDTTQGESAVGQDSMCAPSLKGWWREAFGPSKSDLRVKIIGLEAEIAIHESARVVRERRIEILEKQVAIWEKTYTTVSELAQQRIQDVAMLRQNLNAANEEIERLCMAPQPTTPSKAPRKKKLQPQGNRK